MSLNRKAYNKAYREANREELKAYQKSRYEANREEIRAKNKAYHEANREKINARQKAYYEANREKAKARHKAYHEANREEIRAKNKAYQKANRKKLKTYNKAYHEANRDKSNARSKAYYEANPDKTKAYSKAYSKANREKINARQKAYVKARYNRDPLFRLIRIFRKAVNQGFKSVGLKKDVKSLDCLGCSWEEFQDHIQSQFYDRAETGEKMTLKNHGLSGWHLDHIVPISSAKTKEDVIRLSHYTNFQPLWSEDNYEKGDYFLDNDEQIA